MWLFYSAETFFFKFPLFFLPSTLEVFHWSKSKECCLLVKKKGNAVFNWSVGKIPTLSMIVSASKKILQYTENLRSNIDVLFGYFIILNVLYIFKVEWFLAEKILYGNNLALDIYILTVRCLEG